MADSTDPTNADPTFGMNRRDLLKRGAVVGGTLMWAAPTVQSIGMRAAFAQDAGTPQDADLISCVTIKIEEEVLVDPACYYVKWDVDDNTWVEPGDGCPDCTGLTFNDCTARTDGDTFFHDPTVCEPTGTNDDCLEFCLKNPGAYHIIGVETKNGARADCSTQEADALGLTSLEDSDGCVKAQVDDTSNN